MNHINDGCNKIFKFQNPCGRESGKDECRPVDRSVKLTLCKSVFHVKVFNKYMTIPLQRQAHTINRSHLNHVEHYERLNVIKIKNGG